MQDETTEPEKKRAGRPKLPESVRRREMRTSVSAEAAAELEAMATELGVTPGYLLALTWRYYSVQGARLARVLAGDTLKIAEVRAIDPAIDAAVGEGKVRIVGSSPLGIELDGESVRHWIIR